MALKTSPGKDDQYALLASPKAVQEDENGTEEDSIISQENFAKSNMNSSSSPPESVARTATLTAEVVLAPHSPVENKKEKRKTVKDAVAAQTEMFNSAGTIWHAVKTGNVKMALELLEDDPKLLEQRGPVGENPIHLCFLFNQKEQKELAETILNKYPQYLHSIYENPIYHGETYLHIAIVNKDLRMVRYLLDRQEQENKKGGGKDFLNMPCDGIFFSPSEVGGVTCYYGQYALSFAVCTNNFPMVDFLLEQGADLYRVDSLGNTVLHMCIKYDLTALYEHLNKKDKEIRKSWTEEEKKNSTELKYKYALDEFRNKDGFTVMTMAAHEGRAKMTDFVIDQQKETQWVYGPVSCNIYPLWELDTLEEKWQKGNKEEKQDFLDWQGKPLKAPKSVLELVVAASHLDVLMTDKFKDLLYKKWTRYARVRFYLRCLQTTVWIVALTLAQLMGFPSFEVYTQEPLDIGVIIGRGITDCIVLLGLLYKATKEISELHSEGLHYFNKSGSAFLENNLSFLLVWTVPISIILTAVDSPVSFFFVAVSILLAWSYCFALLLGFKLTGPFVIMIWKMMVGDVLRFATIYLVLLLGFTSAFTALYNQPFESTTELFGTFWSYLVTLFLVMLGNIDFVYFNETCIDGYQWLMSILLLMYVIVISIALLNLLIAMMGDTYQDVKDKADAEWHLAYAQNIMSIESEMGDWHFVESENQSRAESKKTDIKYWTVINGKKYLQVQEVNEKYYDAIRSQDLTDKMDANRDGHLTLKELSDGLSGLEAEERAKLLTDLGLVVAKPYSVGTGKKQTGLGTDGPANQVDDGTLQFFK